MRSLCVYLFMLLMVAVSLEVSADEQPESLAEIGARLSAESQAAYRACPYSALSTNYFTRFSRDPEASPTDSEIAVTKDWSVELDSNASDLAKRMADAFVEFMKDRMNVSLAVVTSSAPGAVVRFVENDGGDPDRPESFTIAVAPDSVLVQGRDSEGLRDGIVKLVERIGLRQSPYLERGTQVYRPRLRVRLGTVPWMGTQRDLVFMGYNATFVSGGSLFGLSTSDAIPELAARRQPGALDGLAQSVNAAQEYHLKTFAMLGMRQKFDKDDPIFEAHPEIRGALTWKADGQYVLCTEHPLVKRYLAESMAGIFRAAPELDGVAIIIGGESFYHCFMRPYGVEKGHTNCERCEPLGAETVVANLCNLLADAARSVNPNAEIIAWPYSAEHVWSADKAQAGFIEKLEPGTGIFTEMEKDEYIEKPRGVRKHLWDYSIDLIGPGERAKEQIAACRAAGIPIYMKSEPELGFEAPRLPHIPCMDRWIDRADALASCGSDGAWVFPAFRPCYGTSAAESYQLMWWEPVPDKESILQQFAARIAGPDAGPKLREAWRCVSDAIAFSPELPPYYTGPYYLGPAHPMCVDPDAELPKVFYGRYLFMAEISDKEGLPLRPTFTTSPRGDIPVFGAMYKDMEAALQEAVDAVDEADPLVPDRCRLPFDAEVSAVRWFYHTARTQANFYESCQLRDSLRQLAKLPERSNEQRQQAKKDYTRWQVVLRDELENTQQALPVMEGDMRLDFYYGGDHTFPHGADMMRAKLDILQHEIDVVLPELAAACGIDD